MVTVAVAFAIMLRDSKPFLNPSPMFEKLKSVKLQFLHILAILLVVLCFAYFFWISGKTHAEVENHNVGEIKTAMISFVTMVLGYFFGSSRSSAKKDEALSQKQIA